MDALERFRSEFRGWVRTYNRVKGFNASPDEILKDLESRIPEPMLRQIGGAFINGWLQSEPEPHRKYFVRESDREGPRGGMWMLEPYEKTSIRPCWEQYVQLADYGRLRTVADQRELTVRLEDHLMDITVYAGQQLLLYVENKTKKDITLRLLRRMREYGGTGFELEDPDKGNDELKKAKYLVREGAYPQFLALSAVGFEQVFRVEYLGGNNRFILHDTQMSLTEPLHDAIPEGITGPRSVVDPLALEIEHLAGDMVWISPGSGKTAYNFYVPSDGGDAIAVGVYEDGRIWTDVRALGKEMASRLVNQLASLGITVDASKEWYCWRRNNQMVNLRNEDPLEIASRVVSALFPGDRRNMTATS